MEAALAAAAAELDHPEPLPPGMGADAVMQALPAAVAASPDNGDLALAMPGDPMVAAALPEVAHQREPRARASMGEEGLYALQVISSAPARRPAILAEAFAGAATRRS